MINQSPSSSMNTTKQHSFGARLKSAREELGMERKDIAAQLRLHEKIIIMIENGEYKTDIPMTFIRGYIRNYSKLLNIPEKEIHDAMEWFTPKPEVSDENEVHPAASQHPLHLSGSALLSDHFLPFNANNIFMKLFSILLVIILAGLVGVWWYSQKSTNTGLPTDNAVIVKTADNASANNADIITSAPETAAEPVSNPASEATTPVAANPLPAAEPAKPVVKTSQILNEAGKRLFAQWTSMDHATAFLMDFILFLLIITAGIRIYAKPMMAGTRNSRIRRHSRTGIGQVNTIFSRLNIKSVFQLSIIAIILSAGAGGALWYKQNKKQPAKILANQPVMPKKDELAKPSDNLQLYADLETLAPSSSLNAIMQTSIKPYALQEMQNQLDDYIAQAASSKFLLTDKSTPIGQFHRKKHGRKYRKQYYTNTWLNSVNGYQQDNQDRSGPPAYYYNYNR